MRIRTIKPLFFLHEGLAELPPITRLFFIGLWCAADCAGRLEDRPRRLKIEIIPYDKKSAETCLEELASAGFIVRYEVNGQKLIEIPGFRRNQVIRGTEAESGPKLPGPNDTGNHEETPEVSKGNDEDTQEVSGREGKGKEGSVCGETHDTRAASDCLPELAARWPDHDVAACLRRAEAHVRKERGPDAVVAVWWFDEHWMGKESKRKATTTTAATSAEIPEPEGWRDEIATNHADEKIAAALNYTWATMPESWRLKIVEIMAEAKKRKEAIA